MNNKNITSLNGFPCIGPCYPANVPYYNPLSLTPIKSNLTTCPIKRNKELFNNLSYDVCDSKDINKDYLTFDIFNNIVQIANTSNSFLKEIYKINNISELVHFLTNEFDILPIYSQKRLLEAIFEVYYKYIEFPKILFSKKLLNVLNKIYKFNEIYKKLDEKKIIKELDKININSYNFYNYFIKKYE